MTSTQKVFVSHAALALSLLWIGTPARAASQVQEVWRSYSGNGFFNLESTGTVSLDGLKRREERDSSRMIWSGSDHQLTIDRIDLDKRWEIDARRKRYTETSIKEAAQKAAASYDKAVQQNEKKNSKPVKEEEPDIRIKKFQTTTTGPGASVVLNGFTTRPTVVKTVIEYESTKDHKPAGQQTFFVKYWTTEDPRLTQYQADEFAFLQAGETGFSKLQIKQIQESIKKMMVQVQAQKDAATDPWTSYWTELAKIKGYPVRTLQVFGLIPSEAPASTPSPTPTPTSGEEGLVEPSDLSGGVGGLVSGIAGRWASKKIEKKVSQKMAERPSWMDEISKEFDSQVAGWAFMTEIKSATTGAPASDTFEVPPGYKKVNRL